MYVGPARASIAGKSKATKTVLPTVAAIACFAIVIVLFAATIVLALIPLYLPQKSATLNQKALTSKKISMYIQVEQDAATTQQQTKRSVDDLSSIVGCTFDQGGLDMVQNTLLSVLPTKIVQNVIVSSTSIAYSGTSKKKRYALSKRDVTQRQIFMIIEFYILYRSGCFFSCQSSSASTLHRSLSSITDTDVSYENVPILLNGVHQIARQIQLIEIIFLSEIIPGLSTATDQATTPETVALITTTLTTSTSTTSTSTTTISTSATSTATTVSVTPNLLG